MWKMWIDSATLQTWFLIGDSQIMNNSGEETKEIITVKEVWICDPN